MDEQKEWEFAITNIMNDSGWTLDRDDETTLGFYFDEPPAKWIRDYDKKTRRFVQFNGNQIVKLRMTKDAKAD